MPLPPPPPPPPGFREGGQGPLLTPHSPADQKICELESVTKGDIGPKSHLSSFLFDFKPPRPNHNELAANQIVPLAWKPFNELHNTSLPQSTYAALTLLQKPSTVVKGTMVNDVGINN